MMTIFAIPCLLGAFSLSLPFRTISTFWGDDFETPAERHGHPKIVEGIVDEGLLTKTRRAVYSTPSRVALTPRGLLATLPPRGSGRVLAVSFRLYDRTPNARLLLTARANGEKRYFEPPKGAFGLALPADFAFLLRNDGHVAWLAHSLADGGQFRSHSTVEVFADLARPIDLALSLCAAQGTSDARVELDELSVSDALVVRSEDALPKADGPELTLDPKKKGWKLVFEDNFSGTKGEPFDHGKWFVPPWRKNDRPVTLDGEGHLEITADFVPGTTNLVSSVLRSVPSWRYGYFEARVRFTSNNGWWSAFWLYGSSNRNSTEDGSEIDIFEDYFIRNRRKPGQPPRIELDHNVHISFGDVLKSYKRSSLTPGSIDEFHVIGCRWTPLSIAIYMDGRLLENTTVDAGEKNVVFDSFSSNALRAPLHVILSGQIMKSWGNRDLTGMKFPESFLVDWVRVWQEPQQDQPKVSWQNPDLKVVRAEGDVLEFDLKVDSRDGVEGAYLFDDGAFLAERKSPPWRFSIPFSRKGYEKTRYLVPGRQGGSPDWERMLHSFTAYVRDEKGRIGATEVPLRYVTEMAAGEAKGFSKGGLVTGALRTVSHEAERSSTFTATLGYRTGADCDLPNQVLVLVDGVQVATVECPRQNGLSWNDPLRTQPFPVKLSKGRHRFMFVVIGHLMLDEFKIE